MFVRPFAAVPHTVSTGVARIPSGSLTATPMRTLPTSMPSRRPRPGSVSVGPAGPAGGSAPVGHRVACGESIGRHAVSSGPASARSAANAASIPAAPFPEPCARSALPPPRPFTGAPKRLTRSLALRPMSCAAGLTATTNGTESPSPSAINATTAGSVASLPLMSPTRVRRSPADIPPAIRCATRWTLPTCSAPAAAFAAAARAFASRIRSSSFSAARSRSTRLATRAGTSSEGTFSDDASPAIRARSLARCRNESSPT